MVETTLAPPQQQQEDETEDMNTSTARKYAMLPEKATITTEPGTRLMKVRGISAYMQVPSDEARYEKGKTYSIELQPGERLHRFESFQTEVYTGQIYTSLLREIQNKNREAKIVNMKPLNSDDGMINLEVTTKSVNYIIQPAGSPDINRTGAANLLRGVSPIWVYKLIERGPCHPNAGLMGYVQSPTGIGYIPRQGEARHGSEISLYKKDIDEFIAAYLPSEEEQQQQQQQLLNLKVPAALRQFFLQLAKPEIENAGYATATRIWDEAKYITARLSLPELKKIGLEKKLTDRNYVYLKATAAQEGWEGHPRRSKTSSPNAYRRNKRELEEIE